MAQPVSRKEIDAVLTEASIPELPKETALGAAGIADFCDTYHGVIRRILVAVIWFLKFIGKGDWAAAVATVVAYLDKVCPVI
jgi:hypothetical protein